MHCALEATFSDYLLCIYLLGIPTLILLDEMDELLNSKGRTAIAKDSEGMVRMHL